MVEMGSAGGLHNRIWEHRNSERVVTFPSWLQHRAETYTQDRVRDLVLQAYVEYEKYEKTAR